MTDEKKDLMFDMRDIEIGIVAAAREALVHLAAMTAPPNFADVPGERARNFAKAVGCLGEVMLNAQKMGPASLRLAEHARSQAMEEKARRGKKS